MGLSRKTQTYNRDSSFEFNFVHKGAPDLPHLGQLLLAHFSRVVGHLVGRHRAWHFSNRDSGYAHSRPARSTTSPTHARPPPTPLPRPVDQIQISGAPMDEKPQQFKVMCTALVRVRAAGISDQDHRRYCTGVFWLGKSTITWIGTSD